VSCPRDVLTVCVYSSTGFLPSYVVLCTVVLDIATNALGGNIPESIGNMATLCTYGLSAILSACV